MSDNPDVIPSVEVYRGVAIEDMQPRQRIERHVKPEIDRVFEMDSPRALFAYCGDVTKPPEARRLAAAKCQAMHEAAAEGRRAGPRLNMEKLKARIAGLGSVHWRSSAHYCSAIDPGTAPGAEGPVPREQALSD